MTNRVAKINIKNFVRTIPQENKQAFIAVTEHFSPNPDEEIFKIDFTQKGAESKVVFFIRILYQRESAGLRYRDISISDDGTYLQFNLTTPDNTPVRYSDAQVSFEIKELVFLHQLYKDDMPDSVLHTFVTRHMEQNKKKILSEAASASLQFQTISEVYYDHVLNGYRTNQPVTENERRGFSAFPAPH